MQYDKCERSSTISDYWWRNNHPQGELAAYTFSEGSYFCQRREAVIDLYTRAFAGAPWFEDLSREEVNRRLESDVSKSGFRALLAESDNGHMIGAGWYYRPSIDEIRQRRGDKLAEFAEDKMRKTGVSNLIWEAELMVHPDFQRRGFGTEIRENFLMERSFKEGEKGVLILTRMKDDNVGTLKIARRLEFEPTGVRVASSTFPGQFHQYWYKLIKG